MSFKSIEKLRKDELITLANEFGVELNDDATKVEILARLKEDGVDNDVAKSFFDRTVSEEEVHSDTSSPEAEQEAEGKEAEPEPKTSVSEEKIIVLMTRRTGSFSGPGYKFTQNHPFQALERDFAESLISKNKGFRQATETEVKSFYG